MKVVRHSNGSWGVRRFDLRRLRFVYLDFNTPSTHLWWPQGHSRAAGIYTSEVSARQWVALLCLRYTPDGDSLPWTPTTLMQYVMGRNAYTEYPTARMTRGILL